MLKNELQLKLPTQYTENDLREKLKKKTKIDFSVSDKYGYRVLKKSLDARKKDDIHWAVRVNIYSLSSNIHEPMLKVPYKPRSKSIVVVGSGPAGFFAAYILQKSGYHTTIVEKGAEVDKRALGIKKFEKDAVFNPVCNYAFGEGGAGTFSDGKLTSRTKGISLEKDFILSSYVEAGADEEIKYLAHPHLGSDNLIRIVKVLRNKFLLLGGEILFETELENLTVRNGKIVEAVTGKGVLNADAFFIAPGHSSYDTFKMLMRLGVHFKTKNFAIGCRIEHPQVLINKSQWGREKLEGVKAAEYRLTFKADGALLPVYTFCMCPGGVIVNASSQANINIVNGMSYFNRGGKFANAALVAGVSVDKLMKKDITPCQALEWLEILEQKFHKYSKGFKAPACTINDFLRRNNTSDITETSYALGLITAPLWDLLPLEVSNSISTAIQNFSRKIDGFEKGNMIGLETKTSSPIQVLREKNGLCEGFSNLYLIGEGSGFSGGIISSAVDGVKAALNYSNYET